MHPNALTITNFYSCFSKLDGDGMVKYYHPGIDFSDPVFPSLKGPEVGSMWKMLCSQAQGFRLTFSDIQADDNTGVASWEAQYIFSKTGRTVHNKIKASFQFQDGEIVQHHDSFNFWKWSIMALGPTGIILGWTPVVKNKVQKQAAHNLAQFITKSEL